MIKLFLFEVFKIANYRNFWSIACLYLTLIFGFTWITVNYMLKGSSLSYDYIWGNLAYFYMFANYFLYFLIIQPLSNQFDYKMIRQHVMDGLSRSSIFIGGILMIFILIMFSTLVLISSGFIFGQGDFMTFFDQKIIFTILKFMLYCFVSFSFVYLATLVFKRSLATIVFILVWQFFIEAILGSILKYIFKYEGFIEYLPFYEDFIEYLPFTVISQLIVNPISGMGSNLSNEILIVSGAYGCMFLFLSWLRLKFIDL